MTNFLVAENNKGERIDLFLSRKLEDKSRSLIQRMIKEGEVLVNTKQVKPNYKLEAGDEISAHFKETKEPDVLPENIPLSILYEDDDLLIIDKPKNMVVHPAPGHYSGTLVNALLFYLGDQLSNLGGELRPGIVHRIDKDTTGALLVAKNNIAHAQLAKQIKEHSFLRIYETIVYGNVKADEGVISKAIGRDVKDRKKMSINTNQGKEAITHYKVLERFGDFTYLRCQLETGRTHQIRVHLKSIGHPVLGDEVYGPTKGFKGLMGQTLHAKVLGIRHPISNEYIEVSAPLPAYFEALLSRFRNR